MTENDTPIDSGAILGKMQLFEQKGYEIMKLDRLIKRNNTLIDNYKEMIQFLMENQSCQNNEFDAKFPGGLFIRVKRKEYIQYIQSEIAKKIQENKTEKIIYNQFKQSFLQMIESEKDIYFLNEHIKAEFKEEIKKKISKSDFNNFCNDENLDE